MQKIALASLAMISLASNLCLAADTTSHPFMAKTPEASDVRGLYTDGIIKSASSVAKDRTEGSLRARMFAVMLEARLSNMPEKFTPFVAPEKYIDSMFQLHGISPPKQFASGHATMCAEQDGKALGAWKIYLSALDKLDADGKVSAHFRAGQVVPTPVIANPAGSPDGAPACWGTLLAGRDEIKADHALATPGK